MKTALKHKLYYLMPYNDLDNLYFTFELSTKFCLKFRIQRKPSEGEQGNKHLSQFLEAELIQYCKV